MQDQPLDPLPVLVVHADWGSQPEKRWMAQATLQDGRYGIAMPEPVGDATTLVQRLRDAADGNGAVLLSFDFAIGVPLAYAERAGIRNFLAVLPELGRGEWERFYTVARNKEEVSLRQPFYPATSGQKGEHQLAYLIDGLGVGSRTDLLRRCDRAHDGMSAASPLFWTLGAKAVGKATILGWKQVLTPALARLEGDVRVWPFHGELRTLLRPGRVVIVETYPAEMYHHLGVSFSRRSGGEPGGKRSQSGRRDNAQALLHWASESSVRLDPVLHTAIEDGFGPESDGEEPFDALVGLCGMLDVVLGRRPAAEPDDERIRTVEGMDVWSHLPSGEAKRDTRAARFTTGRARGVVPCHRGDTGRDVCSRRERGTIDPASATGDYGNVRHTRSSWEADRAAEPVMASVYWRAVR